MCGLEQAFGISLAGLYRMCLQIAAVSDIFCTFGEL
jgi:hypothetical protein